MSDDALTKLVRAPGGINGWHVLAAMLGFFAAIIAVDSVLIYKAVSTFGGDTADAYRIGLNYNQRIAEEQSQDRLGWTETNAYDAARGVLSVTLKDRDGHGIDDLSVTATIGRPATSAADRDLALKAEGQGTYTAAAPNLAEGTWAVSLAASRGDGDQRAVVYRSKARLWKQP
jgi:nitrogen fixation protein FixH